MTDLLRRQRRARRRRKRRKKRQAELADQLRKDPTFALGLLLDETRRDQWMPVIGQRWGAWALKNSRLAAIATLERPELRDLSIGDEAALDLACKFWPTVARRVVEEYPQLLRRPVAHLGDRPLAHLIVRHHEELAGELTRTPSHAARTFGSREPLLSAAFRGHAEVRSRVAEGPVAFGRVRLASGDTLFHELTTYGSELAARVLDRPEVRGIEDGEGTTVAECAVANHPDLILTRLDLADVAFGDRDPLLHLAVQRRGALLRKIVRREPAVVSRLFALPSADGVPLAHCHIHHPAVADRALKDDAVGGIRDPDGVTARRAALVARPGPINAVRALGGAWRERFGEEKGGRTR